MTDHHGKAGTVERGSGSDPFLSEEALAAAMAILDTDRANYSLDGYYAGMGIDPEDVPDALVEEARTAAHDLSLLVKDGRMAVFREVVAPVDWDYRCDTRMHRWWSHTSDLAHAHWAEDDGIRWLLSGSVAIDQIDEGTTIALNANAMLRDEGEVRLLPGEMPVILAVTPRPVGHRHPTL